MRVLILGGLMAVLALFSAGAADFTPPPDTPVIPWTRFSIQYAVRVIGGEAPTGVYFYATKDGGQTWSLIGEDPDRQSPMLVTVPSEGAYGFITVITTRNRPPVAPRPGMRPEKYVIVDRTPPTARWFSPNPASGEVAAGVEGITLQWEAQDLHLGAAPVNIDYSTDGLLWLPVRYDLPAVGTYNWTPPAIAADEAQLRLTAKDLAGNQYSTRTRVKLHFDRTPPAVTILGPEVVGQPDFDIEFTAEDESGVASMDLYYSTDYGNSWTLYGPVRGSPAHFATPLAAETVGLYLAAVDRAGNRLPAPVAGTPAMREVRLNQRPPQVEILAPFNIANNMIDANTPTMLTWNTVEPYPQDRGATLEYSLDSGQTWYLIAANQPNSGSYPWTPQMDARNVLARVSVTNRFGNRGQATSQFFQISANRPTTNISNVTPLGGGSLPLTDGAIPPVASAEILAPQNDRMFSPDEVAGLMRSPSSRQPASSAPTSNDDGLIVPMPANNAPSTVDAATNYFGDTDIPMPASVGVGNAPAQPEATQSGPTQSGTAPIASVPAAPSAPAANVAPSTTVEQITPQDEKDPFAILDNSIPALDRQVPSLDSNATMLDMNIPALNDAAPPLPSTPATQPVAAIPAAPPALEPKKTVSPEQVATLVKQAQAAIERNDFNEAETLANEVLSAQEQNAAADAVLAQVRTSQGRFAEAIDLATRATRNAPGDLNYLEVLSYVQYAEANRLQSALRSGSVPAGDQQTVSAQIIKLLNDAETEYQQLALSPKKEQEKSAYFRLGQIEYFRGTRILTDDAQSTEAIKKAITYYQKAREIGEPNYREILQIGICNYRLRDYEHAETFLEMATETANNDKVVPKEAYYYLASIHEKLNRPQQALEYWEKVVQNYPPDNQYHKAAARRIQELRQK
ncbi:hypothetical protein AGMMS49959_08690 [Planctomycetales bacterium]|nr:hypothetical protein AGMMS49959_08690 [Planctomycetales bacterium]